MKLRVELYYDDESRNWGFRVPALHILGAENTRDEAIGGALEAIDFTLEGVQQDFEDSHEVAYFDVTVTPSRVEAAP